MRRRSTSSEDNFYEIFSDMALLMLAAFIFLFALILITYQLQDGGKAEISREQLEELQSELQQARQQNSKLKQDMDRIAGTDINDQFERVLASAGLSKGKGRKDFEMFVEGLRNLPGHDLHLVVDATGSMHGVTTFLIPVLRMIAIRSGKHLSAVSWYADNRVGTFTGSMGSMFDKLIQQAPFVGADETIGHAFRHIAREAPVPGAYLLIGDEPPTDTIHYHQIPAPVFTLPLGSSDGETKFAYRTLAERTGGRMLELKFQ